MQLREVTSLFTMGNYSQPLSDLKIKAGKIDRNQGNLKMQRGRYKDNLQIAQKKLDLLFRFQAKIS